MSMNIFRFAGDMLHLLSIFIFILKIYASKNCNGACSCIAFSSDPCFGIGPRVLFSMIHARNLLPRECISFSVLAHV